MFNVKRLFLWGHACPSFNPGYAVLAKLAISMRGQFQHDNATQEILCPMVGPGKCAVSNDSCQIFGAAMHAVVQMEQECLQDGYLMNLRTEPEDSSGGRCKHQIRQMLAVQLLALRSLLVHVFEWVWMVCMSAPTTGGFIQQLWQGDHAFPNSPPQGRQKLTCNHCSRMYFATRASLSL